MPDSVGFDRHTGQILTDWDHVRQCIEHTLTTPRYTRIMRRLFGSRLSDLVDAPMNERTKMAAFVAIAEALEPRYVESRQYGEPRFRLKSVQVSAADAGGRITILVSGVYVPRGHVGDMREAGEQTARITY